MSEDREMVKIGCRVPNGVKLRVFEWIDSLEVPGTRAPHEVGVIELPGPVQDGMHVGEPVDTDVDAKLFETWLEANKTSDLVTSRAVYKTSDKDEKEDSKASDEKAAREDKGAADDKDAGEKAGSETKTADENSKAAGLRGGAVKLGDSPVGDVPGKASNGPRSAAPTAPTASKA